jgi:hypothetical protein
MSREEFQQMLEAHRKTSKEGEDKAEALRPA